ncbi:tetratricopeptide repeat protein [Rhizobium sp. BK418]|uniref:tetratricopeptide repeat protein n=1 Tax=Rhizobium sp. BK418 TaxID=2512120 RepID=UPI001044E3F9|nr:tetratricopeptide repeat protein [Rhizobium sp. BK418]TCR97785.1 hypothetical protein EV281_1102 [Rhizobium sp. BK418]
MARALWLLTLLVLISVMGTVSAAFAAAGSLSETTTRLVETGGSTSTFDNLIESVGDQVLKGTRYSGRVRINLPPKRGYLNFFMLRRAALRKTSLSSATCNCHSIPDQESIICDADFVNSFIGSINVPATEDAGYATVLTSLYSSFLSLWLLGHEMGHIVLRHQLNAPTLASDAGENWGRNEEFEADTFVASRMAHHSEQQSASFFTLSQLATSLYAKLAKQQHPHEFQALVDDGKNPVFGTMLDVVVTWRRDWHPPWFVRTIDLFDILRVHYPGIVDTTGYWEALRSRIKKVELPDRLLSPPEWKCADTIIGADVTELPNHDVAADSEFLDRLIYETDYISLKSYTDWFERSVSDDEINPEARRIYVSLIDANGRMASGDATTANHELAESKGLLDKIAEPEIFLTVTYARTAARIISDPVERRAKIAPLKASLGALAERAPETRYGSYLLLDIWETFARTYGFDDPATKAVYETTVARLSSGGFLLLKQDFITRWQIILSEERTSPSEERINQFMAVGQVLEKFDRPAEAARYMKQGLASLSDMSEGSWPFRAYWNDRITRLMMEMRLGPEAVYHAQLSFAYRRQVLDLAKSDYPDAVEHSAQQMGLALNQLGFAHMMNFAFVKAIPCLEESLKIDEALTDRDHLEEGTVWHNLATSYVSLGDFRGLQAAKRALDLRTAGKADPVAIEYSRQAFAAASYLNGDKFLAASQLIQAQEKLDELNDFRQPNDETLQIIGGKEVAVNKLMVGRALSSPAMNKIISKTDEGYRALLNE